MAGRYCASLPLGHLRPTEAKVVAERPTVRARSSAPHIPRGVERQSARLRPIRASSAEVSQADEIPLGCARYQVLLSKPLGIVLEEANSSGIYVAEVVEGGNAARSGQISVGDQLISTSGVIYTTSQTYGATEVRGGEKVVQMNTMNETFDSVLAAIGSHPGHVPVRLEFQRCGDDL